MNGLFASLGLVASSLRGGGGGDGSSRNALIEQAFGGSKGASIAEMLALQKQRESEDATIAGRENRERQILDMMKTRGVERSRAEVLVDQDVAKKFNEPAELRAAQDIRDLEKRKEIARKLALKIAKARGEDLDVLLARAEKDPDAVIELGLAEKIESLTGTREDNLKKRIDNTRSADDLRSTYDIDDDVLGFIKANPDLTETELRQYKSMGPTARGTYKTERAKKLGELDEPQKQRIQFHDKNYETTVRKAEEENAGALRELQDMYTPDLKSGTKYSQWMLDASKLWAKATGSKEVPQNLQQTEQFFNFQKTKILGGSSKPGRTRPMPIANTPPPPRVTSPTPRRPSVT